MPLSVGLADYGVEIHIDDLSKEEILEYIDKENFNALKYLKQDYFNFKKHIGSEFYPRHVDYNMKTIKVVAAIICNDMERKNRIFATARGYGDLKGGWEFPGGKVEPGETPQQALKREIMEELSTEIKVGELIDTIEYDYPTFHLSMDCFWAEVITGQLELKEAEAAKWLTKDQLESVAWLPADITLIDKIRQYMN